MPLDAIDRGLRPDVIVTDTWVSMGKEEEKIARLRDLGVDVELGC